MVSEMKYLALIVFAMLSNFSYMFRWGAIPDQFKRLATLPAKFYLTQNVASYDDFEFDASKAKEIEYFVPERYGINKPTASPEDGQNLCAQTKEKVAKGKHVLTIEARSHYYVYFSTILVP